MKPIALLLLTIFLAPGLCFAAEDQCDLFKKAVRTSVGIDLPPTLEAGKSYTFESSLTIADELALNAVDPNSHIIFWHSFRNNIPGSNGSNSEPSYDITRLKLKKTGESVSAKNTMDLARNLKGTYKFAAFFAIQTEAGDYCALEIPSDPPNNFEVLNHSNNADVQPPEFVSARALSKTVKAGGTFVLETKVTDDSPICGLAESLLNMCSGVWHVSLNSEEGNKIDSFQPNVLLQSGLIVTEVKIPADAKAGQYRLLVHDISDIFGNLFVDIPLAKAPIIEVIAAD